ncbi:MAG TPA: SgcJ/EcaC family oxidoreductase [Gemmataceae bacterium]
MRGRLVGCLLFAGLMLGLVVRPALADEAKDKAAIQKNGEAFVEAFQKGDAKAVAAFWTADGDYTDLTGRHFKGRDAIEKAFAELFAENKGLKARIDSVALRFLTPDVAIEDGITEVGSPEGGPPSRARFTIVHVRKDGQWLASSVRDAVHGPASNYEHLRDLDWVIGNWAENADSGDGEKISLAWTDNQNFILGGFNTTLKGAIVGSATQWIGWDPTAKNVRSWIFDSSGGFGEGAWTKDGKKWVVKTTHVLQDDKKAAATYVLTSVDADAISLLIKDRSLDGEKLPDGKEVKLKRVK